MKSWWKFCTGIDEEEESEESSTESIEREEEDKSANSTSSTRESTQEMKVTSTSVLREDDEEEEENGDESMETDQNIPAQPQLSDNSEPDDFQHVDPLKDLQEEKTWQCIADKV